MIDIRKLEITIEFNDTIRFTEDPEIAFFKIIFKRLKGIVCIKSSKECSECSYCNKCLYYYLSGGDFSKVDSIPIIIKRPFRFIRQYSANDIIDLNYLFLGEASIHMDFFVFLFKELELKGLFKDKNRIIIRKIKTTPVQLENSIEKIKGIEILSPLFYEDDIFKYEFKKLKGLDSEYKFINNEIDNKKFSFLPIFKEYSLKNSIKLGENRIYYKGKIGKIYFEEEIKPDIFLNLLKIIGMGKLYALGGGNIEFISNNVP